VNGGTGASTEYGAINNLVFRLNNALIGISALEGFSFTTGVSNHIFASGGGSAITSGSSNVIIGHESGTDITTGSSNVLVGRRSGYEITTGAVNVCVGSGSGGALETGWENVCVGQESGGLLATGWRNVCVGSGAGVYLKTGEQNVHIGYNAGAYTAVASDSFARAYSTCVGAYADASVDFGVAIGWGTTADGTYDIVVGNATYNTACNINANLHEKGVRVATSDGVTGSLTTPVGSVRLYINGTLYNILRA
jgi:hypothetical protein